ncbi:hypothetical protein TWF730_002555 [Orbilia blumenaviensis]|uniref:Peptidase S8/S53 domain-containing protein n=1 Tax=Orbilia blumenaviensis TaxID=1796055 RepID=A0AAV9UBU8_9PEZI
MKTLHQCNGSKWELRANLDPPAAGNTRAHIAGIISGRTYGVAKGVNLFGVVITARLSDVASGVNAVVVSHTERRGLPQFKGSVLNLSLATLTHARDVWNVVLRALSDARIHIAVAASNAGGDVCNSDPSGLSQVYPIISVGNVDISNKLTIYSNWGRCVDIYAPGDAIRSVAGWTNDTAATESGTSMSAPHVAGVIATGLSLN